MNKTAALHRCELCGETVGEEDLGGYVEHNGPYCIYCLPLAINIEKRNREGLENSQKIKRECALCARSLLPKESVGYLADTRYIKYGGPLCVDCAALPREEVGDILDAFHEMEENCEFCQEEKKLAQDNMRYTWSSNSRA